MSDTTSYHRAIWLSLVKIRPSGQILVRLCLLAAGMAALLALAIGGLALAGYAGGWAWSWRPISDGRAIHPLGAFCMMAIALAAWLARPGRKSRTSLAIAIGMMVISLGLTIVVLAGYGTEINAVSPFREVLAREAAAGRPILIPPMGLVTLFLLSTALVLCHLGHSSAAQFVVGTASIAPIGTLLGIAHGLSDMGMLMGPVGAVSNLLLVFAVAGRMAHKVPLRSVLTVNVSGRLIRLQMLILIGFSLVLSIMVARSGWEQDVRTFAIEVAVLMVLILLTLANAAYRWQQEQQRIFRAISATPPLAAELDGAWLRGEMCLVYQPQVRLADEALVGVEALVRWQHPDRGEIRPDTFIPVAESSGLIEPLGAWVFETACRQAAAWQDTPLAAIIVSINVSALQLNRKGCADRLIAIQQEAGVPADRIVVEVTESVLIQRGGEAVAALRQLREAGLVIAIDDFGTGYSSLSSLQILPSRYLKIDRSFITELPANRPAGMIVRAVVGMGTALGMKVIAEGVETAGQAAFLRQIGCEKAQGYLYGRPGPASDLDARSIRIL